MVGEVDRMLPSFHGFRGEIGRVNDTKSFHTCGNINVKDRKNAMVEITELPIGSTNAQCEQNILKHLTKSKKKIRAPIKKYQVRNLVDGRISYLLHIDQFQFMDLVT